MITKVIVKKRIINNVIVKVAETVSRYGGKTTSVEVAVDVESVVSTKQVVVDPTVSHVDVEYSILHYEFNEFKFWEISAIL